MQTVQSRRIPFETSMTLTEHCSAIWSSQPLKSFSSSLLKNAHHLFSTNEAHAASHKIIEFGALPRTHAAWAPSRGAPGEGTWFGSRSCERTELEKRRAKNMQSGALHKNYEALKASAWPRHDACLTCGPVDEVGGLNGAVAQEAE